MFKKRASKAMAMAPPAAEPALVATIAAAEEQQQSASSPTTSSSVAWLAKENAGLKAENERLKGQIHLLKYKVDLLIDMVTLANLDCEDLENSLENANNKVEAIHSTGDLPTDAIS